MIEQICFKKCAKGVKASIRTSEGIWGKGVAATAKEAKILALEDVKRKLGKPQTEVWRKE